MIRQSPLALASIVLAACGSTVETEGQTTTTTSSSASTSTSTSTSTATLCGSGMKYAEPGCADEPPDAVTLPSAGCYAPCTSPGAPCAAGGTCQKAWTNPCICTDPDGPCCGACGGEDMLCLP